MTDDLPRGWARTTLGEIAEVTQGQSPPGSSYNTTGEGVPFFQGKAEFGDLYPEVRKWTTAPSKFARKDDILLSIRAPVGPTNIAPEDCAIGRGLAAIRSTAADQMFLLWALRFSTRTLVEQSSGSTFDAISGKQLRSLPLKLPPLAEQRRIVEALEALLATLDEAVGRVRRAKRHTKLFMSSARHSLLTEATRPKPGWQRGLLADVLDGIEAGRSFSCAPRQAADDEWAVIKVSAMTWGEFREAENKAVLSQDQVNPDYEIRPGDILVSRANTESYVGAPVMVRQCRRRLLLSDKSLRLVPKPHIDPTWLLHTLASPDARRQISAAATGTKDSMRNISQQKLASIAIMIPPSGEDRAVGEHLSNIEDQVSHLRSSTAAALRRAEHLRRAILTRAFFGSLVSQDPNDEPASELLARINAEQPPVPKQRRPRRSAPRTTRTVPNGTQGELSL